MKILNVAFKKKKKKKHSNQPSKLNKLQSTSWKTNSNQLAGKHYK